MSRLVRQASEGCYPRGRALFAIEAPEAEAEFLENFLVESGCVDSTSCAETDVFDNDYIVIYVVADTDKESLYLLRQTFKEAKTAYKASLAAPEATEEQTPAATPEATEEQTPAATPATQTNNGDQTMAQKKVSHATWALKRAALISEALDQGLPVIMQNETGETLDCESIGQVYPQSGVVELIDKDGTIWHMVERGERVSLQVVVQVIPA